MTSRIRFAICSACLLARGLAIGCGSKRFDAEPPAAIARHNERQPAERRRDNRRCVVRATAADCRRRSRSRRADKPFKLGDMSSHSIRRRSRSSTRRPSGMISPCSTAWRSCARSKKALGPPPVSVEEALELRNDSPEDNAKILGTLGRLAPPDDAGVDYDADVRAARRRRSQELESAAVQQHHRRSNINGLTGVRILRLRSGHGVLSPSEMRSSPGKRARTT